MPAATNPLATDRTSARNSAAVTSPHPSSVRRAKTTARGASAAFVTTSSVRLPVAGISTFSGAEYSRTLPPNAGSRVGHGVRGEVTAGHPEGDPIVSPDRSSRAAAGAVPATDSSADTGPTPGRHRPTPAPSRHQPE